MKIDSTIYLIILIFYYKYQYFIYIFCQSCSSGSENDNYLGTERVFVSISVDICPYPICLHPYIYVYDAYLPLPTND
jgi:hypothetical protein